MDEDMEYLSDYLHRYYVPREAHGDLRARLAESERESDARLRALIMVCYEWWDAEGPWEWAIGDPAEDQPRQMALEYLKDAGATVPKEE